MHIKTKAKTALLSRTDFRDGTFARDCFRCVICGLPAVDAHHIIERRLFKATHEKGGYFLDNGASLCEKHHIEAEQTTISCQIIRQSAGINTIKLPQHFWPDLEYDKWGNVILPEGRLKGELYYELSVQSTLKTFNFLPYSIAPKPCHLPWTKANVLDLILENDGCFEQKEVVILLLVGGTPFTGYHDFCFGQNLNIGLPPTIKTTLLQKLAVLDTNMHIEGFYLEQQIYLSSIWIENDCLDWATTRDFAALLEMPVPTLLYAGLYDKIEIMSVFENTTHSAKEGYELRLTNGFKAFDMEKSVARCIVGN